MLDQVSADIRSSSVAEDLIVRLCATNAIVFDMSKLLDYIVIISMHYTNAFCTTVTFHTPLPLTLLFFQEPDFTGMLVFTHIFTALAKDSITAITTHFPKIKDKYSTHIHK
ncbi:Hypothetical_protein [Hexamita inflata]|uniref:Hypothetical_protein n=1 Tax=Hexamita inflata TaxID=28002 RepID=A0AA86RQC0_9EUKA|nr:Hypothetical protein HINF_LOCUS63817 [Hexamita inflata]